MDIEKIVEQLPVGEREEFFRMAADYMQSLKREKAQDDFMDFVHQMWPGFVDGPHHKIMAKKFQDIAEGK